MTGQIRLFVSCTPFSPDNLIKEARKASTLPAGEEVPNQVKYLARYLSDKEMAAKTIVVEKPYVDRHFLEEYSYYYATTLNPPSAKATRLHFFNHELDDGELQRALCAAAAGQVDEVSRALTENYLGFCVIRPLASAPVGRTILSTFGKAEGKRFYTQPPFPYRVHLCGLRLGVFGVPFQQQEQAVGACATTAIWSSLSQVMRLDGGRAPTPYAVTEAATKNWVIDRAFPATSGLRDEQILESLRQFGYSPQYFEAKDKSTLFFLAVKTYLRSKIPVILKMHYEGQTEAHAVTIVGFREGDPDDLTEISHQEPEWTSLRLNSKGILRLYVHDDRLGPYARASWRIDDEGFIKFKYGPSGLDFQEFSGESTIESAMIPLYPKIRLSAQDLVAFAARLLPTFRTIVGPAARDNLKIDLRFCLAADCLDLLFRSGIAPQRIAEVASTLALSRYVGVIEFSVENDTVAYCICDSTDIRRDTPSAAPLLAIIPFFDFHIEHFRDYTSSFSNGAMVL